MHREDGRQLTGARKTSPAWATGQRSLISEGPGNGKEKGLDRCHGFWWSIKSAGRSCPRLLRGRASLLKNRKAAILRRFPLVLILKEARPEAVVEPLRVKLDPGSKTSGIAVVNDRTGEVVWAAELTHRSQEIHQALMKRAGARRGRRARHTRYRPARYQNRRRPKGWLAPSLLSRVQHLLTWVKRLSRWCPVGAISQELVRFDTAALQHPEIQGQEYQRGTLFEAEVKEYLLVEVAASVCVLFRDRRPDSKSTMCIHAREAVLTAFRIS